MKKLILYLFAILFSKGSLIAQCEGRYQSEIFNSVSVTTVNYSDIYNDSYHSGYIYPDGDLRQIVQ